MCQFFLALPIFFFFARNAQLAVTSFVHKLHRYKMLQLTVNIPPYITSYKVIASQKSSE